MSKGNLKFWRFPGLYNLQMVKGKGIVHSFPRHSHKTFIIGLVEEGRRELDYKGDKHQLGPGSIILLNPGEVHSCSSANGHNYRALSFDINFWQMITAEMTDKSCPYFGDFMVSDLDEFFSLQNLCSILENSFSSLEQDSLLMETFVRLISRYSYSSAQLLPLGNEESIIQKAKDYLRENYSQNISLLELANIANLSPFYLVRAFSRQVGIPPHIYHVQIRINHAKELLIKGLPIADVAIQLGFVDQSHFTRVFKKLMGVTPKEYIKNFSS